MGDLMETQIKLLNLLLVIALTLEFCRIIMGIRGYKYFVERATKSLYNMNYRLTKRVERLEMVERKRSGNGAA